MRTIFTYGLLKEKDRQVSLSRPRDKRWAWDEAADWPNLFEPAGEGVLQDFTLIGSMPDSIVEAPGEQVVGQCYRVPEHLMDRLDSFEGCMEGHGRDSDWGLYWRRQETVLVDGEPVMCEMWQMMDRCLNSHRRWARA